MNEAPPIFPEPKFYIDDKQNLSEGLAIIRKNWSESDWIKEYCPEWFHEKAIQPEPVDTETKV